MRGAGEFGEAILTYCPTQLANFKKEPRLMESLESLCAAYNSGDLDAIRTADLEVFLVQEQNSLIECALQITGEKIFDFFP